MHFDIMAGMKFTEEILDDMERRIYNLYFTTVKDHFNFNENVTLYYETEVTNFEKKYRKSTESMLLTVQDIHISCIQDTCLVLRSFYASLVDYAGFSKYLSFKNSVRIHCLHGESILSVFGICIAIDEITGLYGFFNKRVRQQIYITMNESRPFWRYFFTDLAQRMNSCYKNLEIKLELLDNPPDLSSDINTIKKIKEAHILVMARFFQKFHLLKLNMNFYKVILSEMKTDAFLIYLDTYSKNHHYELNQLTLKANSFSVMKNYRILDFSFENLINSQLSLNLPVEWQANFQPVILSTWIKNARIKSSKKVAAPIVSKKHMSSNKPNTEAVKTGNTANNSTSTNFQNKKKSKPKNKSSIKNANANINLKHLDLINVQYKYSKNDRPHVETKTEKNPKLPSMQNKDTYSKMESKPNAKTMKQRKGFRKLIFAKMHFKNKRGEVNSDKNTNEINDILKIFVFRNYQSKNKCYSEEENVPPCGIIKRNAVVTNLAGMNLLDKDRYYKRNTTLRRKPKEPPKKLEFPNQLKKNKYKTRRLMEFELSLLRYYDAGENDLDLQMTPSKYIRKSKNKLAKIQLSTRKNNKIKTEISHQKPNKTPKTLHSSTGKIINQNQKDLTNFSKKVKHKTRMPSEAKVAGYAKITNGKSTKVSQKNNPSCLKVSKGNGKLNPIKNVPMLAKQNICIEKEYSVKLTKKSNARSATEKIKVVENVLEVGRRVYSYFFAVKGYFNFEGNSKKSFCINKAFPTIKPSEFLLLGIKDTCLSLQKFYALPVNYKEISKYLSVKNPIRIHCLHVESIHSVLGICIAMDEIAGHHGYFNRRDLQQIQVTLSEFRPIWRHFCTDIVKRMNFCFQNIEIKLDLLNNHPYSLSYKVTEKISEADILVMSRFLSKSRHLTLHTNFLEVVFEKMKNLSILFYLDECRQLHRCTLKSTILNTDCWMEIKRTKSVHEVIKSKGIEEYYSACTVLINTDFLSLTSSTYIKYCDTKVDNLEVKLRVERSKNLWNQNKSKTNIETPKTKNFSEKPVLSNLQNKNKPKADDKLNTETLKKKQTETIVFRLMENNPPTSSEKIRTQNREELLKQMELNRKKLSNQIKMRTHNRGKLKKKLKKINNKIKKINNQNYNNPILPAPKLWTKKDFPVKLTKKSNKRNTTEKITLTGKFANMDLEKKNKDERHRIWAKQASFNRYANFDCDN